MKYSTRDLIFLCIRTRSKVVCVLKKIKSLADISVTSHFLRCFSEAQDAKAVIAINYITY